MQADESSPEEPTHAPETPEAEPSATELPVAEPPAAESSPGETSAQDAGASDAPLSETVPADEQTDGPVDAGDAADKEADASGQSADESIDLSMLEASLFCLVEHLGFRATIPLAPYGRLAAFAREFGKRSSARNTPYMFDVPLV